MQKKKIVVRCCALLLLAFLLVSCGTAKLTRENNLKTQNETLTPTTSLEATWWQPEPNANLHWHYQIGKQIDANDLALLADPQWNNVKVFAVDTFDNTAENIAAVQNSLKDSAGNPARTVICYVNVGAREGWRVDAPLFPLGLALSDLQGWPDEIRLDVREDNPYNAELKHIMTARFLLAKAKGCDAVEPDNVDGWFEEPTKLPQPVMKTYLEWLSQTAHSGLSAEDTTDFINWLEDNTDTAKIDLRIAVKQQEIQTLNDQMSTVRGKERKVIQKQIATLESEIAALTTLKTDQPQQYLNTVKDFIAVESDGSLAIGLSIGLKNALELAVELVDQFDWAMNESCAQFGSPDECHYYQDNSFIAKNKAVFWVEYLNEKNPPFCPQEGTNRAGFSFMKAASYSLNAAVDGVERCEVTVVKPVITATVQPTTAWTNSTVNVAFRCVDAEGTELASANSDYDLEGTTTVSSTDIIGSCTNSEGVIADVQTVTINIDKTLPTIELNVEEGSSYDNSAIANPICEFNDATSGINTTASTEVTIDLNTTNDAQTGVISTSKSTSCTAVDNAGNQATITVNYIVETTPLPPTTVLYETTFDNLNNWTSCARGSATLTDLESKSVLHLEGRKGAGTACRRQMIVVTESAPSYSFSCEAKKNAGGYAELEIYFSGERPANGARLVTPVVSDAFATYTVDLENPTNQTTNIYIRLLAKRQSGVDANLYVDSCQLIANN